MAASAEAIRKGRKFDQVLDGARDVFLRDGYEGASVDDIARAAGVSKATLYSYFPDKRMLFLEICSEQCRVQADAAFDLEKCDLPVREVLRLGADLIVRFLVSPFAQSIHRLAVGEADRFPELARQFYRSGPALGHERIKLVLDAGVRRGELKIDDMDLAAEQFSALCKTDLWIRVSFKITEEASEAEIARVVDSAVDMFMARYAVAPR